MVNRVARKTDGQKRTLFSVVENIYAPYCNWMHGRPLSSTSDRTLVSGRAQSGRLNDVTAWPFKRHHQDRDNRRYQTPPPVHGATPWWASLSLCLREKPVLPHIESFLGDAFFASPIPGHHDAIHKTGSTYNASQRRQRTEPRPYVSLTLKTGRSFPDMLTGKHIDTQTS